MRGRGLIVGVLSGLALAGCGGSSHETTTRSVTTTTTAAAKASAPEPAITHRLLTSSEMPPTFSAEGHPAVSSTIAQWLQAIQTPSDGVQGETARLKRIGFITAASLQLESAKYGGPGSGVSLVEQFRSPAGARSELANTLATLNGQTKFSVPGIPDSAGFEGPPGTDNGVNVALAAGDYYYVVGEQANGSVNRAAVIASAKKLYHRVHG